MTDRTTPTYTLRILLFALTSLAMMLALPVGQAQDADDNPVIIQLMRTQIRLDEFNERFEIAARNIAAQQGLPFNEQVVAQLQALRPQYLEQLATELVLLDEAEARGIEPDTEFVEARIAELRESLGSEEEFQAALAQAGFEDEQQLRTVLSEATVLDQVISELQSSVEVSEEEAQAFYEANQDQFATPAQVCARHILLESEETAQELLTVLEEGGDFAELAQEFSVGPSAPQGGDLGCLSPGQTVQPFNDAAFAAEVDEVVGPVETQFGYHLIQVYDRQDATSPDFAEVEEQIVAQLQQQQLQPVIDALRAESGVETLPENLGTAALSVPEDAPETVDPEAVDPEAVDPEETDEGSETSQEETTEDNAADDTTDDATDEETGEETDDSSN
ncbi:MAG: peptidylprolyl isomerase [Trueperaceae bacterium]|nr:peptidylprolyl isomerase [Trueperaceae bacterium]